MKLNDIDFGKLILPGILLIVATYLFVTQTDITTKWFGGGIITLIAIVIILSILFTKKKK